MNQVLSFDEIARLPVPGDNVAIATRKMTADTRIAYGDSEFALSHTLLEGHRFAVAHILSGSFLLSWDLPFGEAVKVSGTSTSASLSLPISKTESFLSS